MGRHEGFANYETWAVNLWLDNDEGLYNEVRERIGDLDLTSRVDGTEELSGWLKDWVSEMQPEVNGLWADLLGAALGEVDWDEIADSQLSDVTFQDDEVESVG